MQFNLTHRQKEICISFIKSKGTNPIEFISKDLNIKKTTVRTHFTDIYNLLLINSRTELMYYLLTKTNILQLGDVQNKV